ncbi:hypothetical protein EDD21DRAFT_431816, partial [Dissophora ornata]
RIYLDEESVRDAKVVASKFDTWYINERAIVCQFHQLRTKFHEESSFMLCRASGPLTKLHVFVPCTVFTTFDKMESPCGCAYAGAGVFRYIGNAVLLFKSKHSLAPVPPLNLF